MPPNDLIKLEQDPEFAKFSYQEQIQLRSAVALNTLQNDPDFLNLSTQDKYGVLDMLVYRPPVFEDAESINPNVKNYSGMPYSSAMETAGLLKYLTESSANFLYENGLTPEKLGTSEWNRDQKKWIDYNQMKDDKEGKFDLLAGTLKLAGGAVGLVGELGFFYNHMVGTLKDPRGLARLFTAGTDKLISKLSLQSGGMLAKMMTAGAHSAAGGMVGVLRENLIDIVNDEWKNPDFSIIASNSAKYFGEYALGDALFFGIGGMLNKIRVGGKFTFLKNLDDIPKTAKEIKKVIKDALVLQHIDNALYMRLPKHVQNIVRNIQAVGTTFKNVSKASNDDIFRTMTHGLGYTVEKTGDELWDVVKTLDDSIRIKNPASKIEVMKWINEDLGKITELSKGDFASLGKVVDYAGIKQKIELKLPVKDEEIAAQLTNIFAPEGGKMTSNQISAFSNLFLKTSNVEDAVVKTVSRGDNIELLVNDRKLMNIPRFFDINDEKRVIKELTEKLSDFVPKDKVINKQFVENYVKNLKVQNLYTPEWVKNVVQEEGKVLDKVGRNYRIIDKNGNVKLYENLDEVGREIINNSLTPDMFSAYLANEKGLKLLKTDAGYTIKKGQRIIAGGVDVEDILNKYPEYKPKIPSSLGPKLTIVNNKTPSLVYERNFVSGGYREVLNHLNDFKNYGFGKKTVLGGNISFKKGSSLYEVELPTLKFKETFSTLDEAKNFLSKGIDDVENLSYMANRKGYRLDVSGNQFVLYSDNGKVYTAQTVNEVQKTLSSVPIPDWAPELSGFTEEAVENMQQIPGFNYKQKFRPSLDSNKTQIGLNTYYQPTDGVFINAVDKSAPVELIGQFRGIEATRDLLRSTDNRFLKAIDGMFRINGKRVKKIKDLHGIDALLRAEKGQYDEIVKNLKLTDDHVRIVDQVKELLGTEESGLFKFYDIDPSLFVENYWTRLREFSSKSNLNRYTDGEISKFLKDAFGNNVPRGLDVWFKHARVSDLAQVVLEKNPLIALSKYISLGNRERFLGPVVDDSLKWLNQNIGKMDRGLVNKYMGYLGDIIGVPQSSVEESMREFTGRFYDKLGLKNTAGSNDIIKNIMASGYLSTMGFRPWLAIRNMQQVWTTLAPRIGNGWVDEGIGLLAKDKNGDIFKLLQQKGIITGDLPIFGGSQFTPSGKLNTLLKKSLTWYRNSDEYTRAIGYLSTKARFDDAVEKWVIRQKNPERFVQHSGIWNLSSVDQDNVMKLVSGQQFEAAQDMFSRIMIDETFFAYRAGMGPESFRGTVGKLFGQMGHYSVNWIENIRRGVGRGSTKQKIAYMTRFVGNSLALYGAFSTVFGIKADNFLPWQPAMFSGGPYYNMMNTVLASISPSYKGQQARAELIGLKTKNGRPYWDLNTFGKSQIATMFTPGSLQLRSLERGMEYLNNGDLYKAFLSLTSAPLMND